MPKPQSSKSPGFPHQNGIARTALGTCEPDSGDKRLLRAEDFTTVYAARLAGFARYACRPGTVNLQHYGAGSGGYPYWRCEHYARDPDADSLHRVLLWTLYCHDDLTAGETEFLSQQRKVRPQTGALLIAPAGKSAGDGDKYFATFWILFRRVEELLPRR